MVTMKATWQVGDGQWGEGMLHHRQWLDRRRNENTVQANTGPPHIPTGASLVFLTVQYAF